MDKQVLLNSMQVVDLEKAKKPVSYSQECLINGQLKITIYYDKGGPKTTLIKKQYAKELCDDLFLIQEFIRVNYERSMEAS